MDNFDAHKWFKKQYLAEDKSDNDKVVAATKDRKIEITAKQMERLHNGEVVHLSNGSTLSFVKEGMSDKEFRDAKEAERLEKHPEKDKIKDIQKMMDKERSLKEDNLNEISRDTYDRMEGLANRGKLNDCKDLIYDLGEEWVAKGFDSLDIEEFFTYLVFKLVRS